MRYLFTLWLVALAVPVAAETILLVDDHDILYRPGTRRQLQVPQRHPANPLLVGPALKHQIGYCSVHRDPSTKRYQLWYQMSGGDTAVCYAESTDGIAWTKPALDVVNHPGIPDRNVVLDSVEQYGASVVVDPPGGDAARRYKLAYWSIPPAPADEAQPKDPRGKLGGMYVAFSPDGVHWTKQPGPVLRGAYGRAGDPPLVGADHPFGVASSVSDVLDASFDPRRQTYVVHAKGWIDGPDGKTYWKRAIVRTESRDFLNWSLPQLILAPDEADGVRPADYPGTRKGVQLHGAPMFYRHGVYFALVHVADFETHGLQPIELALSRDGVTWSRPFRATPFLPVAQGDVGFDAARIFSNSTPVILDDEIRFYYTGAENPWHFGRRPQPWGAKKQMPRTGVGLAQLPLDRFAGVRPLEQLGHITLKARSLRNVHRLTLNADASDGTIRVELLDERGYRIPGFTRDDAVPLQGDSLRHEIAWKDRTLAQLDTDNVIIRIHLDNATAFSVTLASETK